jgi:quinol monooxygenase YgiN
MRALARREFLAAAAGWALQGGSMSRFGMHGKVMAQPGQRDALVQVLLEAAKLLGATPGCEIYFVATSATEPDAVWVTEVWRSEDDHKGSLTTPGVKELIGRGRPLIASFGEPVRTVPVGGKGLTP